MATTSVFNPEREIGYPGTSQNYLLQPDWVKNPSEQVNTVPVQTKPPEGYRYPYPDRQTSVEAARAGLEVAWDQAERAAQEVIAIRDETAEIIAVRDEALGLIPSSVEESLVNPEEGADYE